MTGCWLNASIRVLHMITSEESYATKSVDTHTREASCRRESECSLEDFERNKLVSRRRCYRQLSYMCYAQGYAYLAINVGAKVQKS